MSGPTIVGSGQHHQYGGRRIVSLDNLAAALGGSAVALAAMVLALVIVAHLSLRW
jgi:hypothetical protein